LREADAKTLNSSRARKILLHVRATLLVADFLPCAPWVFGWFATIAFLAWTPLMAQSPAEAGWATPVGSPLDDPFAEQNPAVHQPPEMQVWPGQIPCPAAMGPVMAADPIQPQCPAATTLGDLLFADGRKTPADNRCGSFQKLSFVNTYLPRMGSNGFGWYDVELTSVWGVPFPNKDAPLVITPGFATHWLNGPASLDIPAQLHDVYTEFRWLPKIGEGFRADVAVQPGYYSDWDGSSTRAVRLTGHVSGIYDWTPTFQLVLGAAYLDRPDVEVLPIAGVIWKPDADSEYRLVFPAPKIAWRLPFIRSPDPYYVRETSTETWFYFAGELGGGTWAIRHSDGTSDLMSYGDWRVYLGTETRTIEGISSHIEFGYVFHRLIRLSSTGDDTQVGNTAMVRAGVNY
jgi:hypothetical protein